MASRGKKDCKNCNTEIGARCLLCPECGYHYPTEQVRQDLLKKQNKPKEIKTFTAPGQGRKLCPGCKIYIGAVTKICPKCSFDFSTIKKEVVEKKEKEVKEEVISQVPRFPTPEHKPIPKCSPMEHAKRILGYGKERAMNLLNCHKSDQTWSHVDWKLVEKGI